MPSDQGSAPRARGPSTALGWPTGLLLEPIAAVHERYQHEIVEALGICPFARKSRLEGRVGRLWLPCDVATPTAEQVSAAVCQALSGQPELEIVLVTFPILADHPWAQPAGFEALVARVRAQLDRWPKPMYLAGFHPAGRAPAPEHTTPDNLVPLLRRTPDPLIQCVDAALLDQIRRQAQLAARARALAECQRTSPTLVPLLAQCVMPDSELSREIAGRNFRELGRGPARQRLERILDELHAARARCTRSGSPGC